MQWIKALLSIGILVGLWDHNLYLIFPCLAVLFVICAHETRGTR